MPLDVFVIVAIAIFLGKTLTLIYFSIQNYMYCTHFIIRDDRFPAYYVSEIFGKIARSKSPFGI